MADTYKYVQGDTGPQIQVNITSADGTATDLTGGSVTLRFRATGASTILVTRPLLITNANAPNGIAILQWSVGDLDVPAGNYEGELETVLATGQRETRYELLKFKLREDFG